MLTILLSYSYSNDDRSRSSLYHCPTFCLRTFFTRVSRWRFHSSLRRLYIRPRRLIYRLIYRRRRRRRRLVDVFIPSSATLIDLRRS